MLPSSPVPEIPASLRANAFSNPEDKCAYLKEELLTGKVPWPMVMGGMGTGFSGPAAVRAVTRFGGIGTLTAAASGFPLRLRPEKLAEGKEERRLQFHEESRILLARQIAGIREEFPNEIVAANVMDILEDSHGTVDAIIASGGIDLVKIGAGLPRWAPERFAQADAKHVLYGVIVSSRTAAELVLRAAHKKGGRAPDFFYVELPQYAGGHLGQPKLEFVNDAQMHDPQRIRDEIRELTPDTPVLLGGGIGYRDQISRALGMGYQGVVMGTRCLLTQESGMPDETIRSKYLDPAVRTIEDARSPTDYPARRLDTPLTSPTIENMRAAMRYCVSCLKPGKCKYPETGMQEGGAYCIARDLAETWEGRTDGVLFTGSQRDTMLSDSLYHGQNGDRRVPTMEEALTYAFTHDAPPGARGLPT
ncbi:MAG: nitronate monooxygenase [Candidatus Peribacteraceae bacterium]|nr:nitronate monooxygenase [Candidatus Peribacteraceae bacterium]